MVINEETIGKILVNIFVWVIMMWISYFIGNFPAFIIGIGITYGIWKDWRK